MQNVAKKRGVEFPPSAIGVTVDYVDVEENGAVCAEFDFHVRRWHPAFWLYAAEFTLQVLKDNGVNPLSRDGLRYMYIGIKTMFGFYSPENKGDDDEPSEGDPPGPSVVMSEIPRAVHVEEAMKDVAPRWFVPHPSIMK